MWYLNIFNGCLNTPQKFPNFTIQGNELYKHCPADFTLLSDFEWKLVSPLEKRTAIIEAKFYTSGSF